MSHAVELAAAAGRSTLAEVATLLALERLVPGGGPWEVEIGFGKGRYLLARAAAEPGRRFLGLEMAREYFALVARRLERRRPPNVLLLRADALFALSCLLPEEFAAAAHVYFPDPWPKHRHRKRRLFAPESLDLLVRLLAPGGRLFFATDFLDYGEETASLLASSPELEVITRATPWPDGARTNYEAKYVREGRPILRLEAVRRPEPAARARSLQELSVGATRAALPDARPE